MRGHWTLAIAVCLCGLAGCTLDSVPERGDPCPGIQDDSESPLSYIVKKDAATNELKACSSAEECPEFAKSFELKVCPKEIHACHLSSQGDYYCMDCPSDRAVCDGICIDGDTDIQHCGARGDCNSDDADSDDYQGRECNPKNEVCEDGKCNPKCPADYAMCDGQCIDPQTSRNHCGAKGKCNSESKNSEHFQGVACLDTEECSAGKCNTIRCEAPDDGLCQTETGLQCFNLQLDANHCGDCDTVCQPVPERVLVGCREGECRYNCLDGYASCTGSSGEELCVDQIEMLTDPKQCGECGVECGENVLCIDGNCNAEAVCPENWCHPSEESPTECYNSSRQCGNDCVDCMQEGVAQANCIDGACSVRRCASGYHLVPNDAETPIYTACAKNTDEACAASDSADVVDCSSMFDNGMGACSDGKCALTNCSEGYHAEGETCVVDQVVMDGCNPEVCATLYPNGEGQCTGDTCILTSCNENYHKTQDGQACAENTDSDCGTDGNCAKLFTHGYGECKDNACELVSCDAGYHVNGQECEDDSDDHCGKHGNACLVPNGISKCSNGNCITISCETGYQVKDNACQNNSDTNCGSAGDCTTKFPHGTGKCDVDKCVIDYCESGYHPNNDNNTCESNGNTNCGSAGDCSTKYPNGVGKCTGETCALDYCNSGFHPNGESCEANSIQNCGSHGQACSYPNGTASCNDGTCQLAGCNSGFHVFGDKCEANDAQNCGAHSTACTYPNGTGTCKNGTCQLASCDSGFHVFGDTCEKNDANNCGVHDKKCSYSNGNGTCQNGTCQLTSCNSGFHVFGDTCEKNDANNCGAHDKKCSISHGSAQCNSNGSCNLTGCDSGYHAYDNKCEADSIENCGSHGNDCPSGATSCSNNNCYKSTTPCFNDGSDIICTKDIYKNRGLTGKCFHNGSRWTCECADSSQNFRLVTTPSGARKYTCNGKF